MNITDTLPTAAGYPGTEITTRTQRNPKVESSGAVFQMTIHRHEANRMGLRTVVTTWHTDADIHNGSHPAGTVVTRVIIGDCSKTTGKHAGRVLAQTITTGK